MNAEPLVSIVIPVYNGEDYIESAIDSVLHQDYPKIELIVLDDGSKDRTLEIIKQYGDKFFWESHTNMGQANTLNKGWLMSEGEILSYLSADDFLMSNAVSTSVKHLQSEPDCVLTYCDFNLIDPQDNIIRQVNPPGYSYYEMVVKIVCQPGPGVFFRRNAFEKAGLWNGSYNQMPDYEYWLRLGLIGEFYRIPELLASFRVHNQSQSFIKANPDKSDEPVQIITRYFRMKNIPENIKRDRNQAISNAYLTSAQFHWRAGRISTGFTYLYKAISLFPRNIMSLKTIRVIFNAFFNRVGHKLWWTFKNLIARGPKTNS
jgi:glycosyltransferase involved in cell wall biosynthesis